MASLKLGHMTKFYGFITTSTSPCNNETWQNGKPVQTDLTW